MDLFMPGQKWRMRGGEIAVISPAPVAPHVCANYLDRMSVFTPEGRYWFHDEESEFDLVELIES